MLEPGTYPEAERPGRVSLVETHISWLFFTGRFVYKVKKPVNFGFLDFTTFDQRRFFCLEEVRLNQRLSPDVYLGVVAIREDGGRYAIGEAGRIVECAVKMRQLPSDRWLSGLLRRGDATPALMQRIARRIAAFHADAERGAHASEVGGIATVRFNTQENLTQTREQIGVTVTAEAYDRVRAYTEAFLDARSQVFARRERDGCIRECHGDLHADQICAENGLAFIDCIEFNERFRYGDVAADIAFPAMDVEYYGRPDLAAALVREYVAASGDGGVLDVMDFYKCYRAFTRGKVRGFRLRQPGLTDVDRSAIIEQAARYFGLANQYARLPGPLLVVISGLMGVGKSTLAQALGPRLGAHVLASDIVRKELAGIPPAERRAEAWGEGIYGDELTQRTYQELNRRAGERLRTGQLVILDASFRRAAWRAQARDSARAAGAAFLLIETVCADAVVRERLARRGAGPSDGRLELLDRQREEFEPPVEISARERLQIDTAGAPGDVAMAALVAVYRGRLAPV
ncbi:MAG TPA: AAA family ATPase [Gemmatimonadales bacterium]|nr:AAA family ATPase [Gemmatimonadales bacterium]